MLATKNHGPCLGRVRLRYWDRPADGLMQFSLCSDGGCLGEGGVDDGWDEGRMDPGELTPQRRWRGGPWRWVGVCEVQALFMECCIQLRVTGLEYCTLQTGSSWGPCAALALPGWSCLCWMPSPASGQRQFLRCCPWGGCQWGWQGCGRQCLASVVGELCCAGNGVLAAVTGWGAFSDKASQKLPEYAPLVDGCGTSRGLSPQAGVRAAGVPCRAEEHRKYAHGQGAAGVP